MDYVIGDVHGCFAQLMQLLEKIDFDEQVDRLWFTGDLINRGPAPLEVLLFVSSLKKTPNVVLGNHDLHFLAVYYGQQKIHPKFDNFDDLLKSADVDELANWLRSQRLAIYEPSLNILLTHAGICPSWTIEQTLAYANEVETILREPQHFKRYLQSMYGNEPALWSDNLKGLPRLRLITNYLTRMRYLDLNNQQLLLQYNTLTSDINAKPWFDFIDYSKIRVDLVFGHWAALQGKVNKPHIYGVDTGCYYGGSLTALCLQTRKIISLK